MGNIKRILACGSIQLFRNWFLILGDGQRRMSGLISQMSVSFTFLQKELISIYDFSSWFYTELYQLQVNDMCIRVVPFPIFPKFFAFWMSIFRAVKEHYVIYCSFSNHFRYVENKFYSPHQICPFPHAPLIYTYVYIVNRF